MSDRSDEATPRLARRTFLRGTAALGVAAAGSSLLAACGGGATPSPTAAPAAKPTEAAKPAAPAAPAAAPAASPAAAPAAPAAAASPAAGAAAPAGKPAASPAAQVAPATPAPSKPTVFEVRQLNTTPVIDAQQAFTSIGMHPRLNFFPQEGLNSGYVGLQGAESVLQALAAGRAETGSYNPLNVFPAVARGQALPLKVIYIQHHRAYWGVRVNEESPIKEYKDLAGKKIGMIREGDTGLNAARLHLRQIGLDPEKDVEFVTVGQGGSAGNALKTNQVDALAIWDAEFARIELLGYKMRELANPDPGGVTSKLFGFGIATRANLDWREHIPGFIRGYVKSAIFTITNPEAAIKLHWELYPDSKPSGKSEEEALREQVYILNTRAPWYGPRTADGKGQDLMGTWTSSNPASWDAWVEFLGLKDQIKDTTQFYTNEFVEEANKFDKAAVIQMAKEFKI